MKNKLTSYITLGLNITLFFIVIGTWFGKINVGKFMSENIFNFPYGSLLYNLLFISLVITDVLLVISMIKKKEKTTIFTTKGILSIVTLAAIILISVMFIGVILLMISFGRNW